MIISILKKIASKLPVRFQQELKRLYFGRQIRSNQFYSEEPEFTMLSQWVNDGDFVLDIGANIGHYTNALSQQVGPGGRVIALEPVADTFELLASNVARFTHKNVTLINAAASSQVGLVSMNLPTFSSGMSNYYMAEIVAGDGDFSVLSLPVDSLEITMPVSFVKIDVEGHEISALQGMKKLLQRDHPVLIVEGTSEEVSSLLADLGYSFEMMPGSPNRIFKQSS